MDPKAHHANKIRRTWRVNHSCWSPCRPFQPACGSSPPSPPCSPPPPELPIWITLPNVDTTCLYSGQHILLLSIPPWTNNYLAIKFFIKPFQFFQKAHLLLNNPNLSQTCVQSLYSFIFITHCDNDADYYVTETSWRSSGTINIVRQAQLFRHLVVKMLFKCSELDFTIFKLFIS